MVLFAAELALTLLLSVSALGGDETAEGGGGLTDDGEPEEDDDDDDDADVAVDVSAAV